MANKKMEDNMSEEDQTLHEMKLKKAAEESVDKKEETQPAEPEKKKSSQNNG